MSLDLHEIFGVGHKRVYGPVSAKPFVPDPIPDHRAIVPYDDGGAITYRWHFPRGTLASRMSGCELASFVLGHMPAVLNLLSSHPRVKAEFETMMVLLATAPRQATDRLLPWIRSVTRQADADVIHMSLFDRTEQPIGPTYFILE